MKPGILRATPTRVYILLAIIAFVCFSGLFFYLFSLSRTHPSIWEKLGVTQSDAAASIREIFLKGYLPYAGLRNIKNSMKDNKAAAVTDLLMFTKTYLQSDAFKRLYLEERSRKKPSKPARPRTEKEIRQLFLAGIKEMMSRPEQSIRTTSYNTAGMSVNGYELFQRTIKKYDYPDSRTIKLILQIEQEQYNRKMDLFQKQMRKWEEKYPAEHLLFVKSRLQQVLNAIADVDFSARLMERDGKRVFVNTAYENKTAGWKFAFRAGTEVTETVRNFFQEWVAELNSI